MKKKPAHNEAKGPRLTQGNKPERLLGFLLNLKIASDKGDRVRLEAVRERWGVSYTYCFVVEQTLKWVRPRAKVRSGLANWDWRGPERLDYEQAGVLAVADKEYRNAPKRRGAQKTAEDGPPAPSRYTDTGPGGNGAHGAHEGALIENLESLQKVLIDCVERLDQIERGEW